MKCNNNLENYSFQLINLFIKNENSKKFFNRIRNHKSFNSSNFKFEIQYLSLVSLTLIHSNEISYDI